MCPPRPCRPHPTRHAPDKGQAAVRSVDHGSPYGHGCSKDFSNIEFCFYPGSPCGDIPVNPDEEIINTNKAVIVNFPAYKSQYQTTQSGSATIYIPYPVKQINVKGVDLDFDSDFRTIYFTSDLVNHGALGSGYAGILSDNSSTTKQMTYYFKDPIEVNGSYTFTYHILDTVSYYYPNGFIPGTAPDSSANVAAYNGAPAGIVLFMLEFIGYA